MSPFSLKARCEVPRLPPPVFWAQEMTPFEGDFNGGPGDMGGSEKCDSSIVAFLIQGQELRRPVTLKCCGKNG